MAARSGPTPRGDVIAMHECKTDDEWHRLRGFDITASQIGGLFGVHEYATPFSIYHQKIGNLPPQPDTPAMRRGRILEPAAVAWIREDHPKWGITYDESAKRYFRDPARRLGGTPDLIVDCPDRGLGNIQIKTLSSYDFATKWRDPETDETDPPLWISLQSLLEGHLIGADWCAAAALTIGSRGAIDVQIVDVDPVPGIIDAMAAASLDMWARIDRRDEPQPDFNADANLISQIYADGDDASEIDLTSDDDISGLIDARKDAQDRRRAADSDLKSIDAQIKHLMGDATVAHIGGGRRVTWKSQRRAAQWQAATESRVLRIFGD